MPNRQVEPSKKPSRRLPEKQFYVFTGPHAQGNPALVKIVDQLPDLKSHLKQAAENQTNAPITHVYISPLEADTFSICWFNDNAAIQRCGHGTIAAAAYIARKKNACHGKSYRFISAQDQLTVQCNSPYYSILLPTTTLDIITSVNPFSQMIKAPSRVAQTKVKEGYIILELQDDQSVKQFELEASQIQSLGKRALIITARSPLPNYDIVFRYFAPQYGQAEDIATGSAASVLWPFWQMADAVSPKQTLRCQQLSKKGGEMQITQFNENSVLVSGKVKIFPSNVR